MKDVCGKYFNCDATQVRSTKICFNFLEALQFWEKARSYLILLGLYLGEIFLKFKIKIT
jgi:hypothetical protein